MLIVILNFYNSDIKIFCNFQTSYLKLLKCEIILEGTSLIKEIYFWFFSSKNQNKSSTTSADTKKASILLIRKIYVLMQNLEPLPNDVCLTMKLLYYDEGTTFSISYFSFIFQKLVST